MPFFVACGSDEDRAQKLVDKAQKSHGVQKLEGDTIRFDFRKYRYWHFRNKSGRFYYERRPARIDSASFRDVLTNEGLTRYRNGKKLPLSSKDSAAYAASLNSVVYFAFLPYRLNDPAVVKSYRGKETIGDSSYHRVRVTFEQEGGGTDHEDVYLYWFREKDHRMDFFAYRYEQEGGGMRFREAYNRRMIQGLLVQDYRNYKADPSTDMEKLDELWEKGELEQVSKIETENVRFP